ncbi:MAG: LuxR C-terminal-related transcriptional regulator, partial [Actinomycetia bacterium]|nr:LuxR C-terminal-related transcriptional regulator [Actinomycetes bacterium]
HRAAAAVLRPAARALLAHRDRGVASSALAWLALATAHGGDVAGALAPAREAVEVAEPLREVHRMAIARVTLAEVLVLAGQTDEAGSVLTRLDELVAVSDAAAPGRERAHARVALAGGDARAAATWLLRGDPDETDEIGHLLPQDRPLLVRALRLLGAIDAASTIARALAADATLPPSLRAAAHDELAAIAFPADPGAALDELHRALELRADPDRPLPLGCIDSLEALAEHAATREATDLADVLLGAAARARDETGYRLGAPVHTVERRAETGLAEAVELARRSRGPRRRPDTGWASLTPTENAVVELAAQGLSNPDIAARLYISRGTVKTHLAHVYAKLSVANRTELARLATARPPS